MRYEVNASYFILRYKRLSGEYEVLRYLCGSTKKSILFLLKYYEDRFSEDSIFLTKMEKF